MERLTDLEAEPLTVENAKLPLTSKKPKVAICTASLDTVTWKFMERSWEPLSFRAQPDFDKSMSIIRGSMSVGQKRDQMVDSILKDKDVTHIFMLDNDVLYEDNGGDFNIALRFMMALNLPVCGGLLRVRGNGYPYMVYRFLPDKDGWKPLEDKELKDRRKIVPVDGLGMGCTLIKREVFEAITKPYFLQDKWTEDFYFLQKAKAAGYQTYAVCDIRCSHINLMKIKCDGTIVHLDA